MRSNSSMPFFCINWVRRRCALACDGGATEALAFAAVVRRSAVEECGASAVEECGASAVEEWKKGMWRGTLSSDSPSSDSPQFRPYLFRVVLAALRPPRSPTDEGDEAPLELLPAARAVAEPL